MNFLLLLLFMSLCLCVSVVVEICIMDVQLTDLQLLLDAVMSVWTKILGTFF